MKKIKSIGEIGDRLKWKSSYYTIIGLFTSKRGIEGYVCKGDESIINITARTFGYSYTGTFSTSREDIVWFKTDSPIEIISSVSITKVILKIKEEIGLC